MLLGRLNAIRIQGLDDMAPGTPTPAKTGQLLALVGQRLPNFLAGDEIGTAQRRWQNKEISNVSSSRGLIPTGVTELS